uniref:Homeobox domain-containing protein n=1 Tax=Leptobrachium leishanense TaxID=445787 RepID=A0A8C5N3W4_9ANUR
MHVSFFMDQEDNMYSGPRKYSNSSLPMQNALSNVNYSEYMGYHNAQSMDNTGHAPGFWGSHYGFPREEWNGYGPGPSNACSSNISGLSGQMMYESPDYSAGHHPVQGVMPLDSANMVQISSNNQRHQPFDWMRRTSDPSSTAAANQIRNHETADSLTSKTRTKEKYRVVYTDHQRLELEKEFLSNRYITIRRKSEIALSLGLSDRQVKIWFQNRRAKERKLIKKIGQFEGNVGSTQSDSGSVSPADISAGLYPQTLVMNGLQSMSNVPQVAVSQ